MLPFWGEEEILNLIFAKGRDLSGISAQSDKVLLKKLIFSEEFRGFSHTLGSPLPCTTLALDALLDAVASEFLVQITLVDAQRRGRRTARRSQARLHRAAGYLAAFVKE